MLEHIHEVERAQTVYTQAQMQTHTKMKGNKIQQTESMQMPYGAHMQWCLVTRTHLQHWVSVAAWKILWLGIKFALKTETRLCGWRVDIHMRVHTDGRVTRLYCYFPNTTIKTFTSLKTSISLTFCLFVHQMYIFCNILFEQKTISLLLSSKTSSHMFCTQSFWVSAVASIQQHMLNALYSAFTYSAFCIKHSSDDSQPQSLLLWR